MIYTIHGRQIEHDSHECGIYKYPGPMQRMEYAAMDLGQVVRAINSLPRERALDAVNSLKDLAAQQASWQHTPQNAGFPILRQVPGPSQSIDDVRENIRNTERFCRDVLSALEGE